MPLSQYSQSVAANVRARMAFMECSQTTLAETIGRDQTYISRRTSGKVPFDVEDLALIAPALQTTVGDLIGEAAVA